MVDTVLPEDAQARAPGQGEIRTREQAVGHLERLYQEMTVLRDRCDREARALPIGDLMTRRVFWAFLVKQGQLDGAAKALQLAGMISEAAFTEFHQRALNALIPKVGKLVEL